MPPNKLRYRKYKSFDKIRFLKNVSNLPTKNEDLHTLSVLSEKLRKNHFQKHMPHGSSSKIFEILITLLY